MTTDLSLSTYAAEGAREMLERREWRDSEWTGAAIYAALRVIIAVQDEISEIVRAELKPHGARVWSDESVCLVAMPATRDGMRDIVTVAGGLCALLQDDSPEMQRADRASVIAKYLIGYGRKWAPDMSVRNACDAHADARIGIQHAL